MRPDLIKKVHDRCIEEGDCWIWQGAVAGRSKKPCVNWGGTKYVSRVVYEAGHGPIPGDMVVSNRCHNVLCVSPTCQIMITNQRSRERAAARGAYNNPARIRKLALAKRAKSWITDEMVAQIRAADTGTIAHKETGVSLGHVKAIRRGTARVDYASPFSAMLR